MGQGQPVDVLVQVIQLAGVCAGMVMVTRAALAMTDGRPITFADAMGTLGAATFRAFGTSLALGFAVGLGFVLLVVPGIWLFTIWIVALPAAIIEDLGPVSAAKRSSRLTHGHRWQALALIVLGMVVGFLLPFALGLLVLVPVGILIALGAMLAELAQIRLDGLDGLDQMRLQWLGHTFQTVLQAIFGTLAWRRLTQIEVETT